MIRPAAAQSPTCTPSEVSNVLLDVARQANEQVCVVRRLRKQHSADLSVSEKEWIDNAVQNTIESITGTAKLAEPVPESAHVRSRWFPDSSILQRLRWLMQDSPQVTADSAQLLLAIQSLNNAMSILSSCEGRKPPVLESSSHELSQFINRRRLAVKNHVVPTAGEPPGCIDKGKLRDMSLNTQPVIESMPTDVPFEHTCTMETASEQLDKRKSMEVVNGAETSAVDYLQRIGRVLDHDTYLEETVEWGSEYKLPLMVETAEIWRRKTETAISVATNQYPHQEQPIWGEEANQDCNNIEGPEGYSTSPGAVSDSRLAVSAEIIATTPRQQLDRIYASSSGPTFRRMEHTTAIPPSPVPHQLTALNVFPSEIPRRKPLATRTSFSSSQLTGGSASSANEWRSDGTEYTRLRHTLRAQSPFQDADKEVVSPEEDESTLRRRLGAAVSKLSSERPSVLAGNDSTASIAIIPAPTYGMTRGRAWLERRAESQGW